MIALDDIRARQSFGDTLGDTLGVWADVTNRDRGVLLLEVDRLRAALEEIAWDGARCGCDDETLCDPCIARKALA